MKKITRMRSDQDEAPKSTNGTLRVRTTGRIKKPKAVFDPSDNYISRAQRQSIGSVVNALSTSNVSSSSSPEQRSGENEVVQVGQNKRILQYSTDLGCTAAPSKQSDVIIYEQCAICKKRFYKNKQIITCVDCNNKVHKTCLKIDFEDMTMLTSSFKCGNCRLCELCSKFLSEIDNSDADEDLATCSVCVKSYHFNCCIPIVNNYEELQRNWKCVKCADDKAANTPKKLPDINDDQPSCSPWNGEKLVETPPNKQTMEDNNKTLGISAENSDDTEPNATPPKLLKVKTDIFDTKNIDTGKCDTVVVDKFFEASGAGVLSSVEFYDPNASIELPNVKGWDVDTVANYISKYFPMEANVFRDQEIDGASLLLLKRSDIVKKLPIKLGPSLRLYNLILKIQTQRNDPTLGWNDDQ